MRRLTVLLTMLLSTVALLGLGACSGGSGSDDQTVEQTVDDRLAAAKSSFDAAKYISFTLSSENLPGDVTALESAHGTGTHAPAFTGEIEVHQGLSFSAPIVAVDGKVYAKLPFVSWSEISPADYGAPDPALLMDKSTGLSSLLTATVKPALSGSERNGSAVLTKIRGTLPGRSVQALFPSSALTPFDVTYLLTEDNDLHSVSIAGAFYGDQGDCTYSIDFDLSADAVDITPPT